MSPLRLVIEKGEFRDAHGRQVILRGINVASDSKCPSTPNLPSHVEKDFFDGDKVKFHARPFSKEEAHVHFSRLKRYGYNTIRYIFTWEAIEAAGPGIYDEEWIQHTIEVLRVAKQYGFYVFMDPHQDVWSRFTGGSGAPMWTVYACGLNPLAFSATEASIVHNSYSDPSKFPKMIWATNYQRLAAATIFTLFFAGRDFAPKCIIDGINIQDYLQGRFIAACVHLATRIHEAGDLENDLIFGWESLNEPNRGLIGFADLSVIPKEQALKKGTCPTAWQTMLLGSGHAQEVETWEMGSMGPYRVGSTLVDPEGAMAWLPADYDDSRYNYRRGENWKLGECVWAMHGVWDKSSSTLIHKDYFARHPETKTVIDHDSFTGSYFMSFYRKYAAGIRSVHKDAIMLCQPPVLELPPLIKGTADDDPKMVYAPHFYDGITLMTKHWNRYYNVDVLGVLRHQYSHPFFALKIGEKAIRNCLRDQLAQIRREGLERMGEHPCLMSEFGIPYDMDDQLAYRTGNYSSQSSAMDANYFAVEGARLEGHCLWVYMTGNTHERGDQWNGEDLSILSLDDKSLPMSPVPRYSIGRKKEIDDEDSVTPGNINEALAHPTISATPAGQQVGGTTNVRSSEGDGGTGEVVKAGAGTGVRSSSDGVKPESVAASTTSAPAEITAFSGYRAAEAFVRPSPIAVAGSITHYFFDLANCEFNVTLEARAPLAIPDSSLASSASPAEATTITAAPVPAPASDAPVPSPEPPASASSPSDLPPTVFFLPEYHFPPQDCVVEASSGRWEISRDEDEGALVQRLRWWHDASGRQVLKVRGRVRRYNVPDDAEQAGFVNQCQESYLAAVSWPSCCVM